MLPSPSADEALPSDPDAVMEGEAPQEQAPATDSGDAALIAQFERLVTAPNFLQENFRRAAADRKYVSEDVMMENTQDTVAVNLVLRNQYVGLAYLGVSDPQPFVQPARVVKSVYPWPIEDFAETMEIHLSRSATLMRMGEKAEGAAQDAFTNGISWLKVTLQADYMRDCLGRARFNDQQGTVAEFMALQAQMNAGKILEGTAEWRRYTDLDATLRLYAAMLVEEQIKEAPIMVPSQVPVLDATGFPVIDPNTLQPLMMTEMVPDPTDPRELQRQAIINGEAYDILGLPVMEHYVDFVMDQIQVEDLRWDWTITRPEDLEEADWIAHRTYMQPRDIFVKFRDVVAADLVGAQMHDAAGAIAAEAFSGVIADETLDPTTRTDIETSSVNGRMAVWEMWHKRDGRRYVFVPGARKFLVNEVPQAVGSRWYPFFPVYFNRVTGSAMPISDVRLQRSTQDEYNTLRTHEREHRRASLPVVFAAKDLMGKAAKDAYRNRKPFDVIEVENPEEIKKALTESVTVAFDPNTYQIGMDRAMSDLQGMAGIPQVATGSNSNEDLASAVALAKEGMETGVSRRRIMMNRVITSIFRYMAEVSVRVFSHNAIKARCGQAAVWPRLTTEELYTHLSIEVKGGLSGKPRAKDSLDLWTNFATIAQSLALPVNGPEVLRELLDAMSLRVDYRRFIMPMLPAMPMPGPGAPQGAPQDQGDRGAEGGAPTMAERGAPESMDQIPNGPGRQTPPTPAPPLGA